MVGSKIYRRQDRFVNLVPEGVPVLALDARVGHVGKDQVRQCVGQDGRPVPRDVGVIQQQVNQWRAEKDQPRNRVHEVRHRVEVAQPLRELQARRKQRIVGAQDLNHAASPANALSHVGRKALCGQACRLGNIDVGRAPAVHLHAQGGVRIFRHRLDRDAADLVQCRPAQHRARSAKECRVPEVVPVLHDSVKQFALVGNDAKLLQVALERIGRIEVVGRLQHGQFLVAQ